MALRFLARAAIAWVLVNAGRAAAATCAPVTIGWAVHYYGELAADATAIYWHRSASACNAPDELVRTPKLGGPTVVLASVPGTIWGPFTIDDINLYFFVDEAVVAVPKAGGSVTTLVPAAPNVWRGNLVVASDAFYFSEVAGSDIRIVRVTRDGGTSTILASGLAGTVQQMALDGGELLVGTDSTLFHLALDGSGAMSTIPGGQAPFALDGNDLFFFTPQGIARMPRAGGAAAVLVPMPVKGPPLTYGLRLVASASHLYWVQHVWGSADRDHELWSANRDGSAATRLALTDTALLADGTSLYTTESGIRRREETCSSVAVADPCAPAVLAPVHPSRLVADGSELFALDASGLLRIASDGTAAQLLSRSSLRELRLDATALYTTDGTRLYRQPRDGSAATVLVTGTHLSDLWLDDDFVYFADGGVRLRVPKRGGPIGDGGGLTGMVFAGVDAHAAYGLSIDSQGVTDLWARDKQTDAIRNVARAEIRPQNGLPVLLDDRFLYVNWGAAWGGDGLAALSLDGKTSFRFLQPSDTYVSTRVMGIADAGDNVLVAWGLFDTDWPSWSVRHLSLFPKDGAPPREVLAGFSGFALAVGTDAYYWAEVDPGVMRLPRACPAACGGTTPSNTMLALPLLVANTGFDPELPAVGQVAPPTVTALRSPFAFGCEMAASSRGAAGEWFTALIVLLLLARGLRVTA